MANEMMTIEEAVEMLKSKMDGHTDTSYEWAETVRMAIKALEQTRWISVSEKLPEDLQQVLVTISDGNKLLKVTTCMYTIPSSLFWKDYVTAWMPLPQPYKTESEDEE